VHTYLNVLQLSLHFELNRDVEEIDVPDGRVKGDALLGVYQLQALSELSANMEKGESS
jgi:hypothetical protein